MSIDIRVANRIILKASDIRLLLHKMCGPQIPDEAKIEIVEQSGQTTPDNDPLLLVIEWDRTVSYDGKQ